MSDLDREAKVKYIERINQKLSASTDHFKKMTEHAKSGEASDNYIDLMAMQAKYIDRSMEEWAFLTVVALNTQRQEDLDNDC